jgi:uncharacterized protein YajQ (UPF0234 family)
MAGTSSFDIVSEVDLQEVQNAVVQAQKEIAQRYDFKGTHCAIEFNVREKTLTLSADDEYRLKSVIDVMLERLVRRKVPVKALNYGSLEPASGGTVRQAVRLRVGIEKEDAKRLVKMIKDSRRKVQAQIMDDQVRVSGKNKDDLQAVIALLREADLEFAIQFTNYR